MREGEVAVEDLQTGDLVLTMDQGYQPVRWIGSRRLSRLELLAAPRLRPVCIRAAALGEGLPVRDLQVSRQQRMLVRSRIAQRMFDTDEVLIAAIKLCEIDGIDIVEPTGDVEYFHLLFDSHQVIYAEGAPSESLFTGPEALKGLPRQACAEILTLFPEVTGVGHAPRSARFIPEGRLQKQLIARQVKQQRALIS